jgi:Conjugal transfer protein TraD
MRTWQVERRKRTRQLIELGGLVVKAGIVDLTGDDRATIFGALIWCADKLKSDQGERARALWAAKGKQAFDADPATRKGTDRTASSLMHAHSMSVERLRTGAGINRSRSKREERYAEIDRRIQSFRRWLVGVVKAVTEQVK